jgi:hypothetical protein
MNNYLFIDIFFKVAHNLLHMWESRNNKKWPNKNNDVITDLGGEGNFPMFRFGPTLFLPSTLFLPATLSLPLAVVAPIGFSSSACAYRGATDF